MPAPLVKYAFFFPFDSFCFFVKNQVFVGVWINIQVFDSVPLILLSIFMLIPDCFQCCSSTGKFGIVMPLEVLLLYRIAFTILGFFFPYEVEYHSSELCEEFCWDFDGHCIKSIDSFGKIAIFIMLIMPTQEHGRSFNFQVSFSIFFSSKI